MATKPLAKTDAWDVAALSRFAKAVRRHGGTGIIFSADLAADAGKPLDLT